MLLYFFTLRLLGYRIFRWLFNFTIFWLFNFTKFWWYKVTYYIFSYFLFNGKNGRWMKMPLISSSSFLKKKFINDLKRPYGSWLIPLAGGRVLENDCWRTGHGGHRPTMVCNTVINPLLAMPFTPLHRSTFGRLPEQEGRGKPRVRGAGEGLKQLSRYSQRAAAQCLCLTKNNFLYRWKTHVLQCHR